MRRCTKASCTAASRSNEGTGRGHVGPTSRVEGGAKNSLNESCVAASRDGVGTGSWGDGGEMQRSRNAAKESCVAASASVADIRSFVTVQVGLV